MAWLMCTFEMEMECGWWSMNEKTWVAWIVDYTWYLCFGKLLICGWNMFKVWVGHNSMTLVVRDLGGASSVGCNSMNPQRESLVVPWRKGHNSTGGRGGASGPGRNSTEATWWCLLKGIISWRPCGDASLVGHNSTVMWWCLRCVSR